MKRRAFLGGLGAIAATGTAGCLGGESSPELSDEEQIRKLRTEIDDRGIPVRDIELEKRVVLVEHGYDEPNDAVANVAMAFVERIADEWDVERLEGRMRSEEGTDWGWHVESEWAKEYADGEIGPDEYAQRIRQTLAMVVEAS